MNEREQVTVREYIEALLGNCKEHCRDKFVDVYNTMGILVENQGDSIKTAKVEMDRRLEGMNEFREQLEKQTSTFVDRKEMKLMETRNDERLSKLERSAEKWITNEVVSAKYDKRIEELAAKKANLDGKMVAVIAFICAVVSVLIVIGAEILRHSQ